MNKEEKQKLIHHILDVHGIVLDEDDPAFYLISLFEKMDEEKRKKIFDEIEIFFERTNTEKESLNKLFNDKFSKLHNENDQFKERILLELESTKNNINTLLNNFVLGQEKKEPFFSQNILFMVSFFLFSFFLGFLTSYFL